MPSLTDFQTLYDFHYWARDRLLEGVTQLTPEQYLQPFAGGWGSIRDTLVHTVNAEEIWFNRLQGRLADRLDDPANTPAMSDLRRRWLESETAVRAYLKALNEATLTRMCHYASTDGRTYATPTWQILLHVANHATEHRAQVSTALTALGISHPALDMIFYFRSKAD